MSGYFISFEGGEGCGKSTQIQLLMEFLQAQGHEVLLTREPGGTHLGEALRNIIQHDSAGQAICSEAELLLFAASRAQLAREIIQPALDAGKIILCDRYLDSTTVYQGVARSLDPAKVEAINRFAAGTVRPHCTILLDLDPETGMQRIQARSEGALDRIEREPLEFFRAVRQGYLDLAKSEPERIQVLDASLDPKTLYQKIRDVIEPSLT
ncbi:MAG: Thymidylate kinase [Opitutia bacterium UBA7350]|nr:MAG: Thymidylate kinase [Opitutae bacterium UBA7350]